MVPTQKQAASGETWSVVVLYEDIPTRERAFATCDTLVRKFWAEAEFDFHWWRTDFLKDPVLAQTATVEVCDADVIILSSQADAELPANVLEWFEHCAQQRGEREGMLLDLTEACPPDIAPPPHRHDRLREIARRARLDYVPEIDPHLRGRLPDSWQSAEARAAEVTSVLDEILHRIPPPPHFGLNE